MYKITNNDTGLEIGVTESLRYIRKNPSSGAYIQCSEKEAEAIAFNGVWNIFPFNKLGDEADGQATITEIDITDYIKEINQTKANVAYVAMMTDVELPSEEPTEKPMEVE